MSDLITENISISGHTPKSQQVAFASAMVQLDANKLNNLVSYYGPQVDFVYQGLKQIDVAMPDRDTALMVLFMYYRI